MMMHVVMPADRTVSNLLIKKKKSVARGRWQPDTKQTQCSPDGGLDEDAKESWWRHLNFAMKPSSDGGKVCWSDRVFSKQRQRR